MPSLVEGIFIICWIHIGKVDGVHVAGNDPQLLGAMMSWAAAFAG
jgi:hypothetical protein